MCVPFEGQQSVLILNIKKHLVLMTNLHLAAIVVRVQKQDTIRLKSEVVMYLTPAE